ncbi:hypothetical protein [Breznakiella homolactica]|uniref:DUF4129 domain-containing protein n=1 Tax=Breznakiella homolactica TaxID=2798577 RepID=A0A7T7XQ86_9SPIR|nr:hypothetical protein [Breznakiella homolactica]QQO10481.1 hypothetical protein JFL75_06080 [Breznakiella homolactica]
MTEPGINFFRLRQRSSWEAADSGLLLWRNGLGLFALLLGIPLIILAAAAYAMPDWTKPWIFIALWWLKPLFDRPVLHSISVRFFNPSASLKHIMKGYFRSLVTALPGDLLWRRFSLWRSGRMPVRVLERQRGKKARQRIRILERGGLGFSVLVTLLGIVLETALLVGEIFFFIAVMDLTQAPSFSTIWESLDTYEILLISAMTVNLFIVETLYVCMGFGLYINSRLETEGWDIQLEFSSFARENKPASSGGIHPAVKSLAMVCILAAALLCSVPHLTAQENSGNPEALSAEAGAVPMDTLEEVLASPDFGGERKTWTIQLKDPPEQGESPDFDIPDWTEAIKRGFGYFIRTLLVAAIGAAVVYAAYRLYRYSKLRTGQPFRKTSRIAPDAGPDSPEALLEQARKYFDQGFLREAWASCVAAAEGTYEIQGGLTFPADATEYECLAMVTRSGAPGAEGFGTLIRVWVSFAYGGKAPAPESFEETLAFCSALQEQLRAGDSQGASHA